MIALQPIPPAPTGETVDPQFVRTNIIREPSIGDADPEWNRVPKAQVKLRAKQSTTLPLARPANEPHREEAVVEPRVAKEVTIDEPQPRGPSPLPIVTSANPAMKPVHAAARQHVIRGFSLGDKSAVYAARTEFIQALRTIAQAVDAQAGLAPHDAQSCSMALVRGLEALVEADDFAPGGSQLDGNLDLSAIIAAHRTPACKRQMPASQLAATQSYFDYARDELQRAAASSPVASQALTGLGKTYTLATEKNQGRLAYAKAMVFHQAAVSADPRNHLAANELGVLLAKHGQWEPAKQAFLQSLRVQADAATWQNLAAVHRQLGERDLAELAEHERELLLGKPESAASATIDGKPTVQWVDPKAFAGSPDTGLPVSRVDEQVTPSAARSSEPKSWLRWK
jgi:tetratricopeptide (TPR) repeat protein